MNAHEDFRSARTANQGQGQFSGFNSQNSSSKRIGPSFGSGAYAQKQKVGVLEPTIQTIDNNNTIKNSEKISQIVARKSAGGFSSYKSNNTMRPGLANKSSKAKGYDQFQGKTTNVLEEMQFVVLSDIRQSKTHQFKQLQRLTYNFEESLKQIIYDRQSRIADS